MIKSQEDARRASNETLLSLFVGSERGGALRATPLREILASARPDRALCRLIAGIELGRRAALEEMTGRAVLESPGATHRYLVQHYFGRPSEVFTVVYLDNRHRVIAVDDVFHGTIDGAPVYPREILRHVIARNAAAVILAHQHPSGVCEPSQADELITRRIRDVLALIDVRVLDHVIVAGNSAISMAERGLL
jgi:DNA repair protein RadC